MSPKTLPAAYLPWEADLDLRYGPSWRHLPLLTEGLGQEADARRRALQARIEQAWGAFICGNTKVDGRRLSPGCGICTRGRWSCLFINGLCQSRCFFCPSPQTEEGVPTTQQLRFTDPEAYADYVEHFQFTGVSFSGGEPLLSPERTLSFLGTITRRLAPRVHTWLYTNGFLVNDAILGQLAEAGLQAIRFDLCALDYRLDPLALAARHIPVVTVEIPAVPEDREKLRDLLPRLWELGVRHLNLHQLRLTPHNLPQLTARPYHYAPGPALTVWESEEAALELVAWSLEQALPLPVHYCSFPYKHRYQRGAVRRLLGQRMALPQETLTRAGFLRRLEWENPDDAARRAIEDLPAGMAQARNKGFLLTPDALTLLPRPSDPLSLSYHETALRERLSYQNPFQEVRLASGPRLYLERREVFKTLMDPQDLDLLIPAWQLKRSMPELTGPLAPLRDWEILEEGLLPLGTSGR